MALVSQFAGRWFKSLRFLLPRKADRIFATLNLSCGCHKYIFQPLDAWVEFETLGLVFLFRI